MDYKEILEGIVNIINTTEKSDIGFADICTYIGEKCPELKESEGERIRKELIDFLEYYRLNNVLDSNTISLLTDSVAWLEKQKDFDKQLEKAYKANSEEIFNYGYKAAKAEMGRPDDMDPRWKYAYDLIIADEMYQMSMNDEMVEEARTKASEALFKIVGDLLSHEKQCEKSLNFETAEKEKNDFVSGQFIECRKSFNDFKEDNSYWLEYIGDDNYIGRSDNILNQKFHITPRQLFTLFTVEHCPKNDENDEYNESEEDSIREELTKHLRDGAEGYIPAGSSEDYTRWLKWLEKVKDFDKQLERAYERGNVDGFLDGVANTQKEFEKQCGITKLSEEEQNKFAKGVLSSCAMSFINYLDAHRYEGKMCVSNGECEDIENAFHNAMWDRLHRYYCKYIEKQGEKNEDSIKIEKTLFKALTAKEARDIIISQGLEVSDVLDWIKNKNEFKSATNHETETSKFKVGDWIVYTEDEDEKNGLAYTPKKVIEFYDNKVKVVDTNGDYLVFPKSELKYYHLWSIADAQDGDILAEDSCIFIIQKFSDNSTFGTFAKTYCTLYNDGDFDDGSILYFDIDSTKPATKEQRDILLKKITEEGHEWDVEKKELKKLEKQYNPNFKVGDWIVCEKFASEELNTAKIVNIKGDKYEVEFIDGSKASPHVEYIDRLYHLWTIDDAKDGDILSNGKMIVIFKHFEEPSYNRQYIVAYIGLDNSGHIQVTDGTWWLGIDKAKPATKEQREKLFKAMVDKGYEWDAEKKELKKIELKSDNLIEESYQQQADDLIDMVTEKPAWSEEDDREVKRIIGLLEGWLSTFKETCYAEDCKCGVVWLKSIKERLHPKPQWTEEDENGFGDTLWAINKARTIAKDENDMGNLWYAENWLKELKERIGG